MLAVTAVVAQPLDWRAKLDQADAALQTGAVELGRQLAEEALSEERRSIIPNHHAFARTYEILARAAVAAGKPAQAERCWESELSLEMTLLGRNSAVVKNTATRLHGLYKQHLIKLTQSLKALLDSESPETKKVRNASTAELELTIRNLDNICGIVGYEPGTSYYLAEACYATGNWCQSRSHYEQALKSNAFCEHNDVIKRMKEQLARLDKLAAVSTIVAGTNAALVTESANILLDCNEKERAWNLCATHIAAAERNNKPEVKAELMFRLAFAYDVHSESHKAEKTYKEWLELRGRSRAIDDWETATAFERLAHFDLQQHQLQKAVKKLQLAAGIRQHDFVKYAGMGRAYEKSSIDSRECWKSDLELIKKIGSH